MSLSDNITLGFEAAGDAVGARMLAGTAWAARLTLEPKQEFTGDGSTVSFDIGLVPVGALVFVGGLEQDNFTVSGTDIVFDSAPPNGETVRIMPWTEAVVEIAVPTMRASRLILGGVDLDGATTQITRAADLERGTDTIDLEAA